MSGKVEASQADTGHADLLRAYLDAIYRVRTTDGDLRLIPGQHAGVDGPAPGRVHAVLTACNPGSTPLPDDDNARRQARLIRALNRHGLIWTAAENCAADGTWREASCWITDIPLALLDRLANRFAQNASLTVGDDGICRLRIHHADFNPVAPAQAHYCPGKVAAIPRHLAHANLRRTRAGGCPATWAFQLQKVTGCPPSRARRAKEPCDQPARSRRSWRKYTRHVAISENRVARSRFGRMHRSPQHIPALAAFFPGQHCTRAETVTRGTRFRRPARQDRHPATFIAQRHRVPACAAATRIGVRAAPWDHDHVSRTALRLRRHDQPTAPYSEPSQPDSRDPQVQWPS